MISDITLGQFFPGYSRIHKLDPRAKILLALFYIVAVFTVDNPATFVFLLAITLITVLISRIGLKVVLKGIKPIIIILLITSLFNLFLTDGKGVRRQLPHRPLPAQQRDRENQNQRRKPGRPLREAHQTSGHRGQGGL